MSYFHSNANASQRPGNQSPSLSSPVTLGLSTIARSRSSGHLFRSSSPRCTTIYSGLPTHPNSRWPQTSSNSSQLSSRSLRSVADRRISSTIWSRSRRPLSVRSTVLHRVHRQPLPCASPSLTRRLQAISHRSLSMSPQGLKRPSLTGPDSSVRKAAFRACRFMLSVCEEDKHC